MSFHDIDGFKMIEDIRVNIDQFTEIYSGENNFKQFTDKKKIKREIFDLIYYVKVGFGGFLNKN